MIQGSIDFGDRNQFDALSRQISAFGPDTALNVDQGSLLLQASGARTRVLSHGGALLVTLGEPRARSEALARVIAEQGWAALLPALLASPDETLAGLAGRFSLLWLDAANQTLGLVTDRFNTHSLCIAQDGSRIAFADRADKVPVARQIDPQAIFDYLYFHAIPAPRTIFRGIRRLPPASLLLAGPQGVQQRTWWSARFSEPTQGDANRLGEDFRGIVRAAVERETRAGSTSGAFLSGGTDSSTVVGMMVQAAGGPVDAYSIGFEAEGYDEMEYARITARHYGVRHHEYYITPEDLLSGIPTVAAHYDQPFGNSSAVPAYYCARLARADGITRLLAGDGGDELFGGNLRYAKQQVFERYQAVPAPLRRLLLDPVLTQGWLRGVPLLRKAASYVAQANTPLPDRTEQYNLLLRLGLNDIFEPAFLATVDTGAPMQLQREVWRAVQADSPLNRQLGFDWRFTLADIDLPKVIGTTGLAGVEVAFPLLADELVDFSASLPPSFKLRGQQLRWFFKDALKDFLPPPILSKPKHGFGLPFGPWTLKHSGLQTQARDALTALGRRGIVQPGFLDTLLRDKLAQHPGYYGEMVWICQMLEHWLQSHAPDFSLR
ncbi:asparagine synthetase B family protein [Uliginosibacterium sp. H1]|uniref:asparagine synthetase B family protein n=1 Tax=Uliginosibacterium sp. H1 TaxID=3114757 RepID=UPI002E1726D6|nr:asparagine synthase C-terminal domain-containing protein [Uliginosibacterium sp. H1]